MIVSSIITNEIYNDYIPSGYNRKRESCIYLIQQCTTNDTYPLVIKVMNSSRVISLKPGEYRHDEKELKQNIAKYFHTKINGDRSDL